MCLCNPRNINVKFCGKGDCHFAKWKHSALYKEQKRRSEAFRNKMAEAERRGTLIKCWPEPGVYNGTAFAYALESRLEMGNYITIPEAIKRHWLFFSILAGILIGLIIK